MNTPKTKVELDELLKSTIKSISSSKENWIDYLTFIGKIYKYSNIDQLCIYAQKPEATAVASFEQWKRIGRSINKGTTAIRNYKDNMSRLNAELFDVSETNGFDNTLPRIWAYKAEQKENVLINLVDGSYTSESSITENIVEHILITQNEQNIEDLSKLLYDSNNELSQDEAKEICTNLMAASTAFAVCSRLLDKATEEINIKLFENLRYLKFDTGRAITKLLSEVSYKSEEILRNIERSVKNENINTAARNYQERYSLSTINLARRNGILYTTNRAERGRANNIGQVRRADGELHERVQAEREGLDGNRGQMEQLSDGSGRLLLQPEGEVEQGARTEIPNADIGRLYGGSTEENDNRQGERRNSAQPNVGEVQTTIIEDEIDEEADDDELDASFDFGEHEDNIKVLVIEPGKAPEVRTIENTLEAKQKIIGGTTTEMGIDEYIDVISAVKYSSNPTINRIIDGQPFYENLIIARVDYETGDNHSLTDEDIAKYSKKYKAPIYSPLVQQLSLFGNEIADTELTDDTFKEVYIKDVILLGSGYQHGKYRIYDYFKQPHTIDEKAKFLKKEYIVGGGTTFFSNGHKGWHETFKGKLDIRVDTTHKNYSLTFIEVAKWITDLIKLDVYLTEKEKADYPAYIDNEKIISERRIIAEEFNDVAREYNRDNNFEDGLNLYILTDCSSNFIYGQKTTYNKSSNGDEIIPFMQQALNQIINSNTHLTDRAKSLLTQLADNELQNEDNNTEPIEQETQQSQESEDIAVGDKYNIDGREFIINRVDKETNRVSLDDITFLKSTGYPISRLEDIDFVTRYGKKITEQQLQNKLEQNKNIVKINYTYSDSDNAVGGAKFKFANNISALKTLKKIEEENRLATAEEQSILAKYVGWGGLSKAFDDQANDWHNEYTQLNKLLTQDEYTSARASTLTSFYTEQRIIKHIFTALESFGFKGGNILEPAMGTGNFFSIMPEHMRDSSRLYGVELDDISGRIAKQLYQKANILIQGFEKTDHPDNFFDVSISNVPFGNFKISDKRYDKYGFLIHDYFFAKAIDKVRPGGIVAFITSKGTLDKQSADVRKYIAQRADLIGAIRLPNTAFKALAGTDVTSDIIFLQKRETVNLEEPNWLYIGKTDDGIPVNQYFIDNPLMVLGNMVKVSGPFGEAYECKEYEGVSYEQLIGGAVALLNAEYKEYEHNNLEEKENTINILPADPNVRNYTYTLVDGTVYYRENSLMIEQDFRPKDKERVIGMHKIRLAVNELISTMQDGCSDEVLEITQAKLNKLYDNFVSKFGLINDQLNIRVMSKDNDYNLIAALEYTDKDGNCKKADIFTKRTIKQRVEVTSVDNAYDALTLSLNNRGYVDFAYMRNLYKDKTSEQIIEELGDEIYLDPIEYNADDNEIGWQHKDEYLSGTDIRGKLAIAKSYAQNNAKLFSRNVVALESVIPPIIEAGTIKVKLGSHWVGEKYFNQFMYELINTPLWLRTEKSNGINIKYNKRSKSWGISNKGFDHSSNATQIYGTKKINAYEIIEETLNSHDVIIKDPVKYITDNGNESIKYVVNGKETAISRAQQEKIRNAFVSWVFKDAERRAVLVERYNKLFNNIVIRRFDGSRLVFPDLSPTFNPHSHQRDAVAKITSATNTLLAYVVGAGKTASMIIGAYEQVRLGKATKCLFAVPNHITKQFSNDIYDLYPNAKALIVTDKDFEKNNRQKFLSRIAFSDVNMIVIGHSQFERIMMSQQYQKLMMEKQIKEITDAIKQAKEENGEKYTIKQLEASKLQLENKITKLMNSSNKDTLITFEQLGVDSLFIDEAHNYKNCAVFSKMRNVAGIGNSNSQKAMDMLMKTEYFNQKHMPITFATGTPISNTMTEMYVMQRYLQPDALRLSDIDCFDEWASNFGETTTALELAPEGNGFRLKTRFSKFFNLPELMLMFRQVADIRTSDMLDLNVPKIAGGTPHIVTVKPSEYLQQWIQDGVERCQNIRDRRVSPEIDNMLKFTLEAKLAGLDLRILEPDIPFDPEGKIATCVKNIYMHYLQTFDEKGVQIVFCDSSTPNPERFNAYDELKRLCIEQGIKEQEIAYIHDAKTDKEKEALFTKCRSGEIRVLVGSTQKCGAGTNIQDRLIALHHLDCPYRPSDIEQREGRIIRYGNNYPEVHIYRYVTEKSFDAYLWNILVTKQRFISQIMTSKSPQRECEDIDEAVLSFEAVKAQASGDPRIIEKMNIDNEVSKLQLVMAAYINQIYQFQDELLYKYPKLIQNCQLLEQQLLADIELRNANPVGEEFEIILHGSRFNNKKNAGDMLAALAKKLTEYKPDISVGKYRGFEIGLHKDVLFNKVDLLIYGNGRHSKDLNMFTDIGNITRIDNVLDAFEERLAAVRENLLLYQQSQQAAEVAVTQPFEQEQELHRLLEKQAELNAALDLTEKTKDIIDESDLEPVQDEKNQDNAYENEDEDDLEI